MQLNAQSLLIGIILGGLALALAMGLYRLVRRRLRHATSSIDHSLLLVEYGRKLTTTLDHGALAQLLTQEIPRACRITRAALLL